MHAAQLTQLKRAEHRATLAPLTLPDLTIVLHTAGRTVGARHPLHRSQPDQYSPTALSQMQHLHLVDDPAFHVDATADPSTVCKRVQRLLSARVFRVCEAELEGMQHLQSDKLSLTPAQADSFARALPLKQYSI